MASISGYDSRPQDASMSGVCDAGSLNLHNPSHHCGTCIKFSIALNNRKSFHLVHPAEPNVRTCMPFTHAFVLPVPANSIIWLAGLEFHLWLASLAGEEPESPVIGLILNLPTRLEVQSFLAGEGMCMRACIISESFSCLMQFMELGRWLAAADHLNPAVEIQGAHEHHVHGDLQVSRCPQDARS